MCQAAAATMDNSDLMQRRCKGILKQRTLEDSLNDGSSGRRRMPKRSISFDQVEIRKHRIILDAPSTGTSAKNEPVSAPLTVSWKPISTDVVTLLEYECIRPASRGTDVRRFTTEERVAVLRSAGYSIEQICGLSKPRQKGASAAKCAKCETCAQKSKKPEKTLLARVRRATKKMTMGNDAARTSLSSTAA
ncbi:expressed unknown protein [Seminavis robusta]|uniref:Uncharacterized protein n=1 Tax=Seminavis robusta TaxID=568900 RepID=A0A9N8HNE8_9STRA|nr:expressed unknown protein [Seminavis robusta]|eukprot:Sro1078_g238720.1 n/a (191) ;mRNA; r:7560-8132